MPPKTRGMPSVPDVVLVEAPLKRKYDLVDSDALDCPICTEPLSSPVFQCRNVHIVSSKSCVELTEGCPSCSKPIGEIRCIAIEIFLESVQAASMAALEGCKEMLRERTAREYSSQAYYMSLPQSEAPERMSVLHHRGFNLLPSKEIKGELYGKRLTQDSDG